MPKNTLKVQGRSTISDPPVPSEQLAPRNGNGASSKSHQPTARDVPDVQAASVAKAAAPPRRKKLARVLVLLVLVLLACFLSWQLFLRGGDISPNVIIMTGRIEGDNAAIAAKTGGRIQEIIVREGDQVRAGQVIAVLEDDQLKSREEAAQSAVQLAEARLVRSQQQIAVLRAQFDESQLGVNQARLDAQGRVHQAEAQVAATEAQLAQAQVSYNQARYNAEQLTKLASQGIVSENEGRQARSVAEAQAAVVQAARKQVEAARGGLTTARANHLNPQIRMAQSGAIQQQIAQAQADVNAAQFDLERARAQYQEARANRNDLRIVAPFDGTVATRAAEPGEVVAAGTPIITLVNLGQVYLSAFVPEGQIGRVRVGQQARVYLDSNPQRPLDAIVARINPEASFTPENTYFRDDRVRQVFGVRLQLLAAEGFAKPGMPAAGEILVEGNVWPLDIGRR
jgi:HlyD family secretion protein